MKKSELLQNAKPLLFNTEMVKAILDGRKTVTRRVIKPQPVLNNGFWELGGAGWSESISTITPVPCHSLYNRMPFKPGDILYVRETWFYESHMEDITDGEPDLPNGRYSSRYVYKASSPNYPVDVGVNAYGWRPSIHMPKEAARIFLRVTDVKVEKLNDISFNDIMAEGVGIMPEAYNDPDNAYLQAVETFKRVWDSTVKKSDLDRFGWEANPWVWTVSFERVMFIVERGGRE